MESPFTSVWTREPRAPKAQGLSRDQIVRAAIELLDAEGLDGLSMRKLGAKLGSGATSVYWYVATKDELLELALDEVYGDFTVPEDASWRDAANLFAYGMREAIFKHPWGAALIGSVPALGPNAMRLVNTLLATFRAAGFEEYDADYASSTVSAYVLGCTIPEVAWRNKIASSGLDDKAWNEHMTPIVQKAARDYPELAARFEEIQAEDPNITRTLSFSFGLESILDGMEMRRHRSKRPLPDLEAREKS